MLLRALKKFNGKAENETFQPIDTFVCNDVDRINLLVKGGFCEIASIENPKKSKKDSDAPAETGAAESEAKKEE